MKSKTVYLLTAFGDYNEDGEDIVGVYESKRDANNALKEFKPIVGEWTTFKYAIVTTAKFYTKTNKS